MTRTAAMVTLATVLLLLPGCQLINTILQLAPTALLFLEAPQAVETVPSDSGVAALPLDEALRLGLAAGAEGRAYLVPIGEAPPAEAVTASRGDLEVCSLPVAETSIPPDLADSMAAHGLTLVRSPIR